MFNWIFISISNYQHYLTLYGYYPMQDCRLAKIFAAEILSNVQWLEMYLRASVCQVSRKRNRDVNPLSMVKHFSYKLRKILLIATFLLSATVFLQHLVMKKKIVPHTDSAVSTEIGKNMCAFVRLVMSVSRNKTQKNFLPTVDNFYKENKYMYNNLRARMCVCVCVCVCVHIYIYIYIYVNL